MNDTPPTLTPDDLARIEADIVQLAHAKAASTPGEWLVHDQYYVGLPGFGTFLEAKCCAGLPPDSDDHVCNTAFVALAHNLPIEEHARRLLAEVRRLRAIVDGYQEE